jgi:nitrite reductase/ring-hydroxylating ferredoxin subunit
MTDFTSYPLCSFALLPDPGTLGFSVETVKGTREIILVRKGNRLFGYQNRCPHTGVNLEWLPNQFLDPSESFIQCATHGALFRMEDGFCLRGPCAGDSLRAVRVGIEEGEVFFYADSEG